MPEIDLAAALHAARHAADGPDAVTPESINAADAAHEHSPNDIAGTNTGRGLLSLPSRAAIREYVGDIVSSLSGTDLNTMLATGVWYAFQNNTNAPPVADQRGYFEVIRYNDSYVLQRWTTFAPTAANLLTTWQRVRMASTWSAWSNLSGNDTGWRDIASLADPDVFDFTTTVPGGSYLRWRRIGSTIHLSVRVPLAEGTVGTPMDTRRLGLVNGSLSALGSPANTYIAVGYVDIASTTMCSLTNSSAALRLDVRPIGATGNVSSSITARIVGGNVSWLTDASWPTTLPGTPA